MARITYTVSCCPHCGQEISNDSWKTFPWIMACIGTMFTIFFWLIGIAIINKIFDYEKISIGNPYYKCPHCKKEIRSIDTFEWEDLKDSFKKKWTFRYLIRICYAMSGLVLLGIILPLIFGMWSSHLEVDRISAKVFLGISIVSLLIILYLYYRWKKYQNGKIFVVAERDVEAIKESWGRTRKNNPEYNSADKIKIWGTDRIIKLKEVVSNKSDQLIIESKADGYIADNSNEDIENEEFDEDEEFDDDEDYDEDEECEDVDLENDEEDDDENNEDYDLDDIAKPIDNKNNKHIIVVRKNNKE